MLIKTDPDTIRSYFEDSSNLKGGHAEEVIIPADIGELSAALKAAFAESTPVTISGGGTATTGSRVPLGGIVISMEKFNDIIDISKEGMSAVLGAGVLVEDLKDRAERMGLFYMCHPTEKTAFVGGTVSTNASGSRSFRYGPTRKHVKRLKVVLPDGEVLDVKRGENVLKRADPRIRLNSGREVAIYLPAYRMPDVKNAAGYFVNDGMDLIDLFIGQEGTLAVIAEIEMALVAKPLKILSSFVFFDNEADSWSFAEEVRMLSKRSKSGKDVSIDALSIEYFDSNSVRLLMDKFKNIPAGSDSAIFFEQEMPEGREDAIVNLWLGLIAKHNASADKAWVAMNEKEARDFTGMRYSIPETVNEIIKRRGFQKLSTDIAVPDVRFTEMMKFYVDTFKKNKIEHLIFGHIGESHVHVNLLPDSQSELEEAGSMILEFTRKGVRLGGTVSAEHGIGKIKHRYLEEMYGKSGILEMAKLKKSLDPRSILGLDNIFPKELLQKA